MRISTLVVIDIQTGAILRQDSFAYEGPIALVKGPSDLQKQVGNTDYSTAGGAQGIASGINQTLIPTLTNEAENPQGFGQLGLNELNTETGQNVAGQLGAGKEAALLKASRTGNPNTSSSIIDALTRSGMTQMSKNAQTGALSNLQAKLQQQQSGISGLERIQGQEQNDALSALGLTNTNQQDIAQEEQAKFNSIFGPIMGLAGAATGAAGDVLAAGK